MGKKFIEPSVLFLAFAILLGLHVFGYIQIPILEQLTNGTLSSPTPSPTPIPEPIPSTNPVFIDWLTIILPMFLFGLFFGYLYHVKKQRSGRVDKILEENFVEDFERQYGREPTDEENPYKKKKKTPWYRKRIVFR